MGRLAWLTGLVLIIIYLQLATKKLVVSVFNYISKFITWGSQNKDDMNKQTNFRSFRISICLLIFTKVFIAGET